MSDTPSSSDDFLRVSASSNPHKVAQAISYALDDKPRGVKVRAVGAGAVNQAIKAVAIARGYVAQRGHDLTCRPGFDTIPGRQENGESTISAIVLALNVV